MKRFLFCLFVFLLGICVGALGIRLKSGVEYWRQLPEPSSAATAQPMLEHSLNPADIRSGEPTVRGAVFSRTAGGSSTGGIWECEGPAVIDFTFGADERLYVLEGSVDVEYLGNQFSLKAGETAIFRAGTTATWNIPVKLKKVWVVHDPGRIARAMSFLSRSGN